MHLLHCVCKGVGTVVDSFYMEQPLSATDVLQSYQDRRDEFLPVVTGMTQESWDIFQTSWMQIQSTLPDAFPGPVWPWRDYESEERDLAALGYEPVDLQTPATMSGYQRLQSGVTTNFILFFRDLPGTYRVALWRLMMTTVQFAPGDTTAVKKQRAMARAESVHWGIKEALTMTYGVRSGIRGVGMKPLPTTVYLGEGRWSYSDETLDESISWTGYEEDYKFLSAMIPVTGDDVWLSAADWSSKNLPQDRFCPITWDLELIETLLKRHRSSLPVQDRFAVQSQQ